MNIYLGKFSVVAYAHLTECFLLGRNETKLGEIHG